MSVSQVGKHWQVTYHNPIEKKTMRLGTLALRHPYNFAEKDDAVLCSLAMKATRQQSKKAAEKLTDALGTLNEWTLDEVKKGLDIYFLELAGHHLLRQRTMNVSLLMTEWVRERNERYRIHAAHVASLQPRIHLP